MLSLVHLKPLSRRPGPYRRHERDRGGQHSCGW